MSASPPFIRYSIAGRYLYQQQGKNRDPAYLVPLEPVLREKIMTQFTMARALKSAVAAGSLLTLGGCMYGTGYYGDGYVNGGYDCDPYAPFDDYYACDYGYGFANIGFGGGWYDQYYYPGYGIYIFDRGGRRHVMRDSHRRHWARQRAEYGGHHARDRNPQRQADRRDRRYDRRDATPDRRRSDRTERRATQTRRTDQNGQAAPTRNRSDRTNSRPARATEQSRSRPAPAARPAEATRPAPRSSSSSRRNGRMRTHDD